MRPALLLAVLTFAVASFAADPPGVTRFAPFQVIAMVTGADGEVYVAPFSATGIFHATSSGPVLSIATADPVRALAAAPDGSIWFATAAYYAHAMPGGAVTIVPGLSVTPTVPRLAIASDGALWYRTESVPRLHRRDPSGTTIHISTPEFPFEIVPSSGGAVWVSSLTEGVFRVTADGTATRMPTQNGALAMAAIPDGGVWVSLPFGFAPRTAARFSAAGVMLDSFPITFGDALAVAPDGGVYVAEFYPVIFIHAASASRSGLQQISLDPSLPCGSPAYSFRAMAVAADGTLWVAQAPAGSGGIGGPVCTPPPEVWALIRISAAASAVDIPAASTFALIALMLALGAIAVLRSR